MVLFGMKTWSQFWQAPHEEKSVRFKKGFIFSAIVKGEGECWPPTPANVTGAYLLALG